MASDRGRWLSREGFTLDTVVQLFSKTVLNPTLTLPLFLLASYTLQGKNFVRDHPRLTAPLKVLLGLGAARVVNNYLNRKAVNNWTNAKPDWSQELVVITGGSDGMGRLLVDRFEKKGVKVIVLDIQDIIGKAGPNVHYIHCDLSSNEAIQSACAKVREEHGNPSVLILNAGITNRHSILNTPDHLLRRVFDINTLSHYRLVKEFLPAMISANHGLISTTASLAGFTTCAGFHEGLTSELLTRHSAPSIRTLCICPNFVATKLANGFHNPSTFISPTLHPETVVDVQFRKIWNWEGGLVPVPGMHAYMACMIRSWPDWMQIGTRNGLKDVMIGVERAEQERVEKLRESGVGGGEEGKV